MALDTDAGSAGDLTREQVRSLLVQPLEQTSVFLAAGPRVYDTDGNALRLPKLTGTTSPGWTAEGEQIAAADPGFGEITLLPQTMKSLKVLTRFSNELARQSVINLTSALRDRLVRDTANALDQALIAGDGGATAGTEPTGILNYSGTNEQTGVGTPDLDALHDAVGTALGANVDPNQLQWLIHSRDLVTLRKLTDADGRYQLQPDPTLEGAYRLLGHPVTVSNRIPTTGGSNNDESSIVLWDPSQVAVARDLAPSVTVLTETFGDTDQQALRVVARYDAAPLNPEAVTVLRNVTA